MRSLIIAGSFALFATNAFAQSACPTGTSGPWTWSASGDSVVFVATGLEWQSDPDAKIPVAGSAELELSISWKFDKPDEKPTFARFVFEEMPKNASFRNESGSETPAFDVTPHPYTLKLAPVGNDQPLSAGSGWKMRNKLNLSFFDLMGTFEGVDAGQKLAAWMTGDGPIGAFLMVPIENQPEETVTFLLLPEEGRKTAWDGANLARLSESKLYASYGVGCTFE